MKPTVSIITAVYNSRHTVARAIDSVLSQKYPRIELVVIDGNSSDGTDQIIHSYGDQIHRSVREPDDGIYDALNKGLRHATGDVVGFLHADDLFADEDVINRIAEKFTSDAYDAVYGDLTYVDSTDTEKVIRYWQSKAYRRERFRYGWMPPHPTVYVKKEIYETFGCYRTDMGTAADYECMVRLMYRHKIRVGYIPKVQVRMGIGGQSNVSIENRWNANASDQNAWLENGLKPPWGLRITKPVSKLPQYWRRP